MKDKLARILMLFAFVAISIVTVVSVGQGATMKNGIFGSIGAYEAAYENIEPDGNSFTIGHNSALPRLSKSIQGKITLESFLTYAETEGEIEDRPVVDAGGSVLGNYDEQYDGEAFDIGVVANYRYPFKQAFSSGITPFISAKLGATYSQQDSDASASDWTGSGSLDLSGTVDGSTIGLTYGIGTGLSLSSRSSIRLDYTVYSSPDVDGSLNGTLTSVGPVGAFREGNGEDVTNISLGYVYKF